MLFPTLNVQRSEPACPVAVTEADPTPVAITSPCEFTRATLSLDEFQLTIRLRRVVTVGSRRTESPTPTVLVLPLAGFTNTVLNGSVISASATGTTSPWQAAIERQIATTSNALTL